MVATSRANPCFRYGNSNGCHAASDFRKLQVHYQWAGASKKDCFTPTIFERQS